MLTPKNSTCEIEQIMLAKNEAFCIGSMAALRSASGMTRNQAQSLLKSFVHESWLTMLCVPKLQTSDLADSSYRDEGKYVLGPRAEAELETYL